MSAPILFWLVLLFIGGVGLLFTGVIVYQITKAVKRAGGVQGIANQMQAQAAAIRPAWHYPIAAPIWPAGTALGCGVAMALLGLVLVGGGWFWQQYLIREMRLLQNEGVVATAVVAAQRISESDDSETYYVTFAFTAVANDQRVDVRREVSVPESFYERVEYGSQIEVVYARSDPRIVKIRAMYTPGKVAYWPLILLGGLGALCLFFAWLLFGTYRNARRLDEEGLTTSVVLVDCFEHSDSDSTSYYVAYELPGGGPIRHTVEKKIYDRLSAGQTFRLAYLPDNPKIFRPLWG
ncbi:MAG TPA: DUF3592 domain-containing protein [Anaerolineae bacterium]|nr:DUF3592 domain-containing protein [Anaerolineae bacterium]